MMTRGDLVAALSADRELIANVIANPPEWYGSFDIERADGRVRTIRPPHKPLRKLQRKMLEILYGQVRMPGYLHGGIPRRSVLTHARPHVDKGMVVTLDLRNFFPSTTPSAVEMVFSALGFAGESLRDSVRLTCLDEGLPQGAPTSSFLANLAFLPGDCRLRHVCRTRDLTYTRYVDDIAISGAAGFRELRGPFVQCIEEAGYSVASEKIAFMPAAQRQVVTGLVVNLKLRPERKFIRNLKHDIRLCRELGPGRIAVAEGLVVRQLQSRLTGRAAHVGRHDRALGKRLRGMLCGVDWKREGTGMSELDETDN